MKHALYYRPDGFTSVSWNCSIAYSFYWNESSIMGKFHPFSYNWKWKVAWAHFCFEDIK